MTSNVQDSTLAAVSKRQFDLVIFGATGFTGFFVIRELVLTIAQCPEKYEKLKWAIAGRNESKLDETLKKVSEELKINLTGITKVVADVGDQASLVIMCRSAGMVLNCVGPFRDYGEAVIKACLETRTHHLDITAELDWIDKMQLKYHKIAIDRGIIFIFCCGIGCLPTDVGLDFLKQSFAPDRLHSADCYFETRFGPAGYRIHSGTLESLIDNLTVINLFKISQLESKVYQEILPKKPPKREASNTFWPLRYRSSGPKGWSMFYWIIESPVAKRTQRYNYEHFDEWPASMRTFFKFTSTLQMIGMVISIPFAAVLNQVPPCRWLVKKLPAFFTLGWFSKAGPTRAQIDGATFSATFVGRGWSVKEGEDPSREPHRKMDKKMKVEVSGPDPGYITTAMCLVQGALTLFDHHETMHKGMLTTASAFRGTRLVENLERRGIDFRVLDQ